LISCFTSRQLKLKVVSHLAVKHLDYDG